MLYEITDTVQEVSENRKEHCNSTPTNDVGTLNREDITHAI